MAVFTTETRLSDRDAPVIIAYAREYVHDYGIIQRYVYRQLLQNKGKVDKSKLNTEVQQRFSVTKRTANSVISDMQGRYKALKELKKTEKYQLKVKIEYLEENAGKLVKTINNLKEKARLNKLTEKQLVSYRNMKKKLYFLHQRIQKKKDILSQLENNIQNGYFPIGFGSRRTFDNQHRLKENGFKSHKGWYNDYVKRRDCNIYYLGSSDETAGNQMFQLSVNKKGNYDIKIRKDGKYVADKDDKYVTGRCSFSYMDDILRDRITRGACVSYRIKVRDNKVYLQAVFQIEVPVVQATTLLNGAIGLDFNNGHIDLSETDGKGNLVKMKVFPLKYHGTGNKAKNEMRQVIAEIGKYALMTGKSIIKEDLSFIKKKATVSKGSNKKYNKMIHTFDYKRYEDCLKNISVRKGIDLIDVNPAYTSQIAKAKYCEIRKLPIHNGAAYVIARRGQGFEDKIAA